MTRLLASIFVLLLSACREETVSSATASTSPAVVAPAAAAGAPGRDGTNGMSVKTVRLEKGDEVCPNGGAMFLAADGESYACNGDPALHRFYGSGSAGEKVVTGREDWTRLSARELQFASLIIETGATVEVASGTVIRSQGTVEVRGTIVVHPGVRGPDLLTRPAPGSYLAAPTMAGPGIASVPAFAGDLGDDTWARSGGRGGVSGIEAASIRTLIRATAFGGGAGAASFASGGCSGGGSVVIAAAGAISLEYGARIDAAGESCRNGGGGGGGGVVVLASAVELTVDGEIAAHGGAGGANTSVTGAGGGGGGGIVHAVAPVVSIAGELNVSGGVAGGTGTPVSFHARSGGAGGGASAGNGGGGGAVTGAQDALSNTALEATRGGDGLVVVTEADPASLL